MSQRRYALGRESHIGRALELVVWCAERERPFATHEMAEALELGVRGAYRWIASAEAAGVIERVDGPRLGPDGHPARYRCVVRLRREVAA